MAEHMLAINFVLALLISLFSVKSFWTSCEKFLGSSNGSGNGSSVSKLFLMMILL